jgi:hypothetical protein
VLYIVVISVLRIAAVHCARHCSNHEVLLRDCIVLGVVISAVHVAEVHWVVVLGTKIINAVHVTCNDSTLWDIRKFCGHCFDLYILTFTHMVQ